MTMMMVWSLLVLGVQSGVCKVSQESLSSQDLELTAGTEQNKILDVKEDRLCLLLKRSSGADCSEAETGQSVRTGECVERLRSAEVEDSTRTCSASGSKVCHSPCYNCPVACRKTIKTVCQLTHQLVRNVSEEAGVLREEEAIKKNITCHEEDEEKLCAPINCKYVNISSTCTETRSGSVQHLDLRSRECPLCGPRQGWTKHCAGSTQEIEHFLQEKDESLESLQELPRSVSSQVSPAERTIQSLKEDLLLIIQKEEKLMQANLRMMTNLNVKPENVNVNIKYNIVTNTEKSVESNQTNTVDPILNILDNVIKIPAKQPKMLEDEVSSGTIRSPTSRDIITDTWEGNKELYIDTTTVRATGATATRLTAADLLRLCFTSGQGCDFSQDFASSTEPNTTPSTPTTTTQPTTTTTVNPRVDQRQQEIKERLRQRLKLCFFSGICGNEDKRSKVRQPRIIGSAVTATIKPKSKTRRAKMKLIIQKKARSCFFHGNCT